ncbi:MAG: zinc ribbon domain-containing protein [Verrucomicrobiota bacterium]|nr:zinc ribbon domain-containing protein [Verrucomicrobiota bacterium]
MTYDCDLDDGQQVVVENDGERTLVSLSSGDEAQRQSQSTGFDTGKWSKAPLLFRAGKDLVLRLETKEGAQFLRIRGRQIQRMRSEPDLEDAEELRLKKSGKIAGMKPMQPMPPMKIKPPKPLQSMRPMEMRMGDMYMSMGAEEAEPEKRFCAHCGKPAKSEDRYCAHCGQKLSEAK